jgi:hypothetical protein
MARDDNPFRDFELAQKLGPAALLQLRAEVLLQSGYAFTTAEYEVLERIAVVPREGDDDFLAEFDFVFAPRQP